MNDYTYKIISINTVEMGVYDIVIQIFEILKDKFKKEIYVSKKGEHIKEEYILSKKVDQELQNISMFRFTLSKDSIQPKGVLQDCFDVYHEHKNPENLNPNLREMWIIANICDNLGSTLNKIIFKD